MFKYNIEYQNDAGIWVELKNWIRPIMNKSTLDETHDETQVFLSCSPITTPFKPFTKFIINISELNDDETPVLDENGNPIIDTLYRVVIADEITQVVFEQTEDENGNIVDGLYDHDIRLAEASKELERYTVDNLSFTNEWKKAFSSNGVSAYITGQSLSNDYWDNGPSVETITTNVLRIETQGQLSSRAKNIKDGFITSLLYTYDVYNIEKLQSAYLTGSRIWVSPASYTFIPDIYLGSDETPGVLGNYINYECYALFNNHTVKVKLIKPDGSVEEKNVGDNITLTAPGKYTLEYEITRNVRVKTIKTSYVLWIEANKETTNSRWYTGLTTYMKQDFYVVDNFSERTEDKLTVYDILQKIVDVTPTNFESASSLFRIDDSVQQLYGNYKAPEMIFTNKNLWEVLREIGGVINAIPYLKIDNKETWNNIAYLPLSSEEPVKDVVEEQYCNSTSYYDSENYTANYDLTVDNMINPYADYEGVIHEQGWYISKTIRSEEFEISETTMDIETTYPIYTINHLYFVDMTTNEKWPLDLYVYEKALYNTLVSNTENQGQAVALFYTQSKPNIKGLQLKVSKNEYSAAENKVSIKKVLAAAGVPNASELNLINCKFIVEYTPYLNARIKYYKTNAPKLNIKTSMFQNQSANVLDARALGRKMVANIGRVGNLGYVDSLKVYSLNKIPLKGQRAKDGYFVSIVTTEYDQNHLLSSVQYTKDYQKISDFINIQNLQRFFEVSEKQSIHRYINTNMFYIFGENVPEINKIYGLNQQNDYPNSNYLASLLIDQGYNRKINASVLKAYSYADEDSEQLKLISYLYLNSNAIATGNNISIITDFYDNYGAGYQAYEYNDESDTQAYMNRAVPYADKLGRIQYIEIRNVTDSNINYGAGNSTLNDNFTKLGKALPQITDIYPQNNEENKGLPIENNLYIRIADTYQNDNLPTVSNIGCNQNIYVEKDSREILHFNQQHHFLTNDNNIIIGNAMTEYCRFIQNRDFSCKLVFLNNKIDAYEFKIKESDIIENPVNVDNEIPQTVQLNSLCTKIDNNNILNILSTTNNQDDLYLQPMLNNQGYVFGLRENAKAWAIITDTNELIIGRNEDVFAGLEGSLTTRINMSVTSEY